MAYVGSDSPAEGCVFCEASSGDDDVQSLVVFRGERTFVILNLFPYNTGHVMVVPLEHAHDPAALSPATRAEMAEVTASLCTGLRVVMGCDGLNCGMNLGSAAGAGIADHLHQHIVPRWTGDANFMPIVGATKVLPELLPTTYARIRADIARNQSGSRDVIVVIWNERGLLATDGKRLPRLRVSEESAVWQQVRASLSGWCETCELIGWAGEASVLADRKACPVLAVSVTTRPGAHVPFTFGDQSGIWGDDHRYVQHARERFGWS